MSFAPGESTAVTFLLKQVHLEVFFLEKGESGEGVFILTEKTAFWSPNGIGVSLAKATILSPLPPSTTRITALSWSLFPTLLSTQSLSNLLHTRWATNVPIKTPTITSPMPSTKPYRYPAATLSTIYPHPQGNDTIIKPTMNSKAPTKLSRLSTQSRRSLRYCRTRATEDKHTAVRMHASRALLKQKVLMQQGCRNSPPLLVKVAPPVSVITSGSPSGFPPPAPLSPKALHMRMSILSQSSVAVLCSQRFKWICVLPTACFTSLVNSCTVVDPDADIVAIKEALGTKQKGSNDLEATVLVSTQPNREDLFRAKCL